jgi:hypothetical protein
MTYRKTNNLSIPILANMLVRGDTTLAVFLVYFACACFVLKSEFIINRQRFE